jgi:hypothetical protein
MQQYTNTHKPLYVPARVVPEEETCPSIPPGCLVHDLPGLMASQSAFDSINYRINEYTPGHISPVMVGSFVERPQHPSWRFARGSISEEVVVLGHSSKSHFKRQITEICLYHPLTGPGATAFTRIPFGPSCFARDRVKVTIAPLVEEYSSKEGDPW